MRLSDRIAKLIVHRPRRLWAVVIVLVALASGIIAKRAKLNSDVLDMLPGKLESVGVYKIYDREFSQARELMFGLLDEGGTVDLDAFTEHFATELRKEPWVERVMERSPIDAPGALDELRAVALPLLLNQPDITPTLAQLQPDAVTARIHELAEKLRSGSDLAAQQLEYDPLGIVFPALKPLATSMNLERTRPTASTDQTLRVLFACARQTSLDEAACAATMQKVEAFKTRVLAAWDGPRPQILCTGRTPYVAEMSGKLKGDISSTVISSIVLVALVFYAGFRRWRPLHAIVDALLFCCVMSVACGAAFFGQLNMITIGLCAILVGLGVDFAMMLYGLYLAEREAGMDHERAIAGAVRSHGRGIWFGALTTAGAFLCLLRSESPGFVQLGTLIACGILIAAATMLTLFWLFLGIRLPRLLYKVLIALLVAAGAVGVWFIARSITSWSANVWQNIASGAGLAVASMFVAHFLCKYITRLPAFVLAKPSRILVPSTIVLLALSAAALAPVGHIIFDIDTKSLEPRDSNAGHAMRTIIAKLQRNVEPLLVVISADDPEVFSERWDKAQSAWAALVANGALKAAATPASFAFSPSRMAANAARLPKLEATRTALTSAIQHEELNQATFASAFGLLDTLSQAAAGELSVVEWRRNLPTNSAWWFLLERFLGSDGHTGVAFLWPPEKITNATQAAALRSALVVPGVETKVSGWSFTLAELDPWAKYKLKELTCLMVGLNIVLLSLLLRQARPVIILILGLALSVGALCVTLKVTGIVLNLFNVLAFPLVLGVGVDYGIYVALAMRTPDPLRELTTIIKPVLLSGLTTVVGFGSLAWAQNPALRGLGLLCGIGVGWCILVTFLFVLPACALGAKASTPRA
jgi:predicted exporter